MCDYCEREKDLGRLDLDDELETFVYLKICDGIMKLYMESNLFDDELVVSATYCPMCGKRLEVI